MFSASFNQSGSAPCKHCKLSLKPTKKPEEEEATTTFDTAVSAAQISFHTTTTIKSNLAPPPNDPAMTSRLPTILIRRLQLATTAPEND